MTLHSWPYSNITNLVDWSVYANDLTGGYFGVFILVGLFVVSFAVGQQLGFKRSILGSTFLTFITSVILRSMGVLADMWVVLSFGGLLGLIAVYLLRKRSQM